MVVLSALYFSLFYSGVQIKNILVSGNDKVRLQDLKSTVSENSSTTLFKLWNFKIISDSIFLADNNKIEKQVLQKFPKIETANVNKKYPQTLELQIAERKPVAVFCDNNENGCFLIDNTGVIFETSNDLSGDFVIVRQALENKNSYVGDNIVAKNTVSDILQIQKDLKDNFNISISEALISSPIRLNVKTAGNWQIYFDLSGESDINSQLLKLNALLGGDINPSVQKTLQYIDLRFKDRAYYK